MARETALRQDFHNLEASGESHPLTSTGVPTKLMSSVRIVALSIGLPKLCEKHVRLKLTRTNMAVNFEAPVLFCRRASNLLPKGYGPTQGFLFYANPGGAFEWFEVVEQRHRVLLGPRKH